MFCCTLLYVHSIFTIILMEKRELVSLSCDGYVVLPCGTMGLLAVRDCGIS